MSTSLLELFGSGFSPFVTAFVTTCTACHLGGATALLERYDGAWKYYQEAIKACTEVKFRPELALTGSSLPNSFWTTTRTRKKKPLKLKKLLKKYR